jgi:hypothetical protein
LQQDFVLTIGLIILQAAKRPAPSSAPTTSQKATLDLPSFDDEDEDDDDDFSVMLDSQTDNSTMDEATPPKKVSVTQKSIEFMIKLINCLLNRQGLALIMRGGRLVEAGINTRRRAGRGQNQSPPELPGVEGERGFE